jgi:hypothetical protein
VNVDDCMAEVAVMQVKKWEIRPNFNALKAGPTMA